MIKPDIEQAIYELKRLHTALDGVLMCCPHNSNAYDLALNVRSALRSIARLIDGEGDIDEQN